MLDSENSSQIVRYRVSSGTEVRRNVQWRKLSRKRKLKLTKRALKNIQANARAAKIDFGIDDYRHVTSLVYSEMPFNPNGHHCSCSCLDEVIQHPGLTITGMNYGTMLKQSDSHSTTESSLDDTRSVIGSYPVSRDSNKNTQISEQCHSGSCLCHRHSISSCLSNSNTATAHFCLQCKHAHCSRSASHSKHDVARRISIAKDDGSIRSKIYGLKKELRNLKEQIKQNENSSIQSVVGRRYSAGEREQLKALLLSDELRHLKVKEMLYRSKNAELLHRISNGKRVGEQLRNGLYLTNDKAEDDDDDDVFTNEEEAFNSTTNFSPKNSLRKGSYKENMTTFSARRLPALIEEDEEAKEPFNNAEWEITRPNEENLSRGLQNAKSFEILVLNNDYDDEDNALEDDDTLSKTWPMFQSNKLHYDPEIHYDSEYENGRGSENSQRTVITRTESEIDPVKRLAYRLDSGLTFGLSSPTREILEESFIETKEKIDQEKLSGSKLKEEEYYKTLNERQTTLASKLRQTIRDEIYRRGSVSEIVEETLSARQMKQETNRRQSLVVDEKSIEEFVSKAEEKSKIIESISKTITTVSPTQNDEYDEPLLKERDDSRNAIENENHLNEGEIDIYGKTKVKSLEKEATTHVAKIGSQRHIVPRGRIFDLSALRNAAEKHQTLRSLARLDEEFYKVSDGVEKLNAYRKKEAKENVIRRQVESADELDGDTIGMTRRERRFSIPEPMNSKSAIEVNVAENDKIISKLDFKYDMIRDLRYLIMNQSTSREFSYSYLKPAPPYLKTKWEKRVKRGFLRGVKEDKINEKHLEDVEDVTLNLVNREAIHSETLNKDTAKKRNKSRKLSNAERKKVGEKQLYDLPPLQLPPSRTPSPNELIYWKNKNAIRSKSLGAENLHKAFTRLSKRHKFEEKDGLMRDVVRLSTNETYRGRSQSTYEDGHSSGSRSVDMNANEETYVPKLNKNRRRSSYVQNFVMSDPVSGRLSISSDDAYRRTSII